MFYNYYKSAVAQSVYQLATGLTTEKPEFESLEGQEFSVLHIVQTGSGANPASYSMGVAGRGSFSGGKEAGA
jgi:hypothetical protein